MELISKIGGTILVVGTILAVWKDEAYLAKSLRNSRDNHEIADAPSVVPSCQKNRQVERAEAEWIDMGDFEKCSVCKSTHLKEFQSYYGKVAWVKTPYCPYCGAKMRGDKK